MRTHVLIGFLLACTAAAQPVEDRSIVDHGVQFTEMDLELFSKGSGLWVYDDDGNLVKVTLEEDDSESEEETRMDLHNRVMFFLFTRKNPTVGQQLFIDDEETLEKSNFDPRKPTRFVTHGWINSRRSPACTLVRDAYIQHGDYNVIVIDWSRISVRPYMWASNRVKMVGIFVSTMLNFLENHGLQMSETTMVGHSLGAHVVGLASHYARGKVNYIVGCDPALPGFMLAGAGSRISSGDANYVEIIHTNAGLLGYLSAIGDSDFYPNGGIKQSGCLVDLGGACSHARSFRFFAESINSKTGFYAKPCKNFVAYTLGLCKRKPDFLMGEHKRSFKAKGSHFLKTRARFPFAIGK